MTFAIPPTRRDRMPPIAISTPPVGATYTQGQVVLADFSCADTGGSGLATCVGDVPDGAGIDTSTSGVHVSRQTPRQRRETADQNA